MTKIKTYILFTFLSINTFSQTPYKFDLQIVIRDDSGKLLINKSIGLKLSILKNNPTGVSVYEEIQIITSNINGLVVPKIGHGTPIKGDISIINWSQGPYFLKTEMDLNGGENYTLSQVTELFSVPYALAANSLYTLPDGVNVGDMNFWDGSKWVTLNKGKQGQFLIFLDGKPSWANGVKGPINNLDCENAIQNGSLILNKSLKTSTLIKYYQGNGNSHNGQVVASSGVTGLTATLQPGSFANGNGSLTYTITGTPSTIGTASFAINIGGQRCTLKQIVQSPVSGFGQNIKDIDGNSYKTVYIGTQQWMAENLKTTKYNDSTSIPNITNNEQWKNNSTGAWSHYLYLNNQYTQYGKLYNWYVVQKNTNGNKNVCPKDWHVPTDNDWKILIDYLGGNSYAGCKMKEIGTTTWVNPNTCANNTSLFSALPGGYRSNGILGGFEELGQSGLWWSSSEYTINEARCIVMSAQYQYANLVYRHKNYGLSIRCLKD